MLDHVEVLRCPVTGSPLSWLRDEETAQLNQSRVHADGSEIAEDVDRAIGTADRKYVYRFSGGIFWLLPTLAIVSRDDAVLPPLDAERRMVQTFYDDLGWSKTSDGSYFDSVAFTERDEHSQRYAESCDRRIAAELSSGTYLLDAACGAIPHESIRRLSDHYQVRVCIDFSIRALREAQSRLGEGRGLFVLGDLARLPLADESMDDAISLHTIYHMPRESQAGAIDELVRVVKPQGKTIVVYSWSRSVLMKLIDRAMIAAVNLKGKLRPKRSPPEAAPAANRVELFFVPQDRAWFDREVRSRHRVRLKLWASTDRTFHQSFFARGRGRVTVPLVLAAESVFGPLLARIGQYPMFVITKR